MYDHINGKKDECKNNYKNRGDNKDQFKRLYEVDLIISLLFLFV